MFESTQQKFTSNKANVEGLLALDSTKPARRAILEETKTNEIVQFEEKIGLFEGVWNKQQ